MEQTLPANTGQIQAGRFQPGQSGNPAGKPKGARHKTTLAVQALLDGEAEALTRKAIDMGLVGDITALRLCLERIIPARKDTPISFELSEIEKVADITTAMRAVLNAVANGEITPSEGAEVSKLVDTYVKTVGVHDFSVRLAALEESKKI